MKAGFRFLGLLVCTLTFHIPWRKDLTLDDHFLHLSAKNLHINLGWNTLDNPKASYPVPLSDEKLINRVHYQLESPDVEISLLQWRGNIAHQ